MVVYTDDAVFSTNRHKQLCLEYGMTREGLEQDIDILKEWVRKQPHLPDLNSLNEAKFLKSMLLLSKDSVERAKTTIDTFFTVRTANPSIFLNRSLEDSDIIGSFEHVKLIVFPGLSPEGHRVMLFQLCPEADLFSLHPLMIRASLMADYLIQQGVDFNGIHVMHDLRNIGLAHLARFSIPLMRSMAMGMKTYPVRIPKVTLLNTPAFFDKFITLFRSFLSPKLMSRVSSFKDASQVLDILPSRMIPKDYGGAAPSLDELNKFWRKRMEENEESLYAFHSLQTDESKRIVQKKVSSEILGQNGSFRQLSVD